MGPLHDVQREILPQAAGKPECGFIRTGMVNRPSSSPDHTVKRLLTLSLLAGIATVAIAQTSPPIARYVPPGPDRAHVFVMDSAHILSAATIAALQDSTVSLQAETHADIAWVTLPTLGGRAIEEAALYIGRAWKIGGIGEAGDPLRNRGLVILYVPDKTKTAGSNFRVEVGNGLEGTITDSRSRAITTAMRGDLRAKRFDDAYAKGWTVAASLVREDFASRGVQASQPAPAIAASQPRSAHRPSYVPLVFVVAVLAVLFVLLIRWALRRGAATMPSPEFRPRTSPGWTDDAEEHRRRGFWTAIGDSLAASGSGDSDGGSGDSGSSGGGDFGGGGGFSGGGSSDSI